jgi:hypothetical protein
MWILIFPLTLSSSGTPPLLLYQWVYTNMQSNHITLLLRMLREGVIPLD